MNPLNRIKNQTKSRPLRDSDLKYIHHRFMSEYGWIPLEEFRKLPLPTFWNLYSVILESDKQKKEEYDKKQNKKR